MTAKHIVGIGGAHVDWIAQMSLPEVPGASMPGRVETHVGGCCLNSLRVIAQLMPDHTITMISARGGDGAGEQVQSAMEEAGLIDQSAVFLDRKTPTYTAVLSDRGDLVAAVADMRLYEDALPRHLGRREVRATLNDANILVVDTNLPATGIEKLVSTFEGLVIGFAISPAKARRLIESGPHIDLVFMNAKEHAALGDLKAVGLKKAVITNGTDDVLVLEDGDAFRLPVVPETGIVDVTGAGDALAGATIAAHLKDPSEKLWKAVNIGIAAATQTVKAHGPIASLDWAMLTTKAKPNAH